jgi:hypothetical protein
MTDNPLAGIIGLTGQRVESEEKPRGLQLEANGSAIKLPPADPNAPKESLNMTLGEMTFDARHISGPSRK